MSENNNIKKVLLTQPNYLRFDRRYWKMYLDSLDILTICTKDNPKTELFDPNFRNLSDEETIDLLKKPNSHVAGVSTNSTEYIKNVDSVNFHIATPLHNTEFYENIANVGYSHGVIFTEEFSPQELQISRAFEWGRINFRSQRRGLSRRYKASAWESSSNGVKIHDVNWA